MTDWFTVFDDPLLSLLVLALVVLVAAAALRFVLRLASRLVRLGCTLLVLAVLGVVLYWYWQVNGTIFPF